jgi:hypothetical protein
MEKVIFIDCLIVIIISQIVSHTAFMAALSSIRIHYLEFAPGVLDKHYEKLLQFDSRLLELSRIPFPSFESRFFPSDSYNGITETSLDFSGHGSNIAAGPDSQPVQAYYQIHQPCLSIMNPTGIPLFFPAPFLFVKYIVYRAEE